MKYLHQLLPADLCVLYAYDAGTDDLEARHVTGVGGAHVRGLRIELGHRLSGWVAANRRTIVNSDPVLDLGELSRSISPPLRSSLSTPLVLNDELVGVVTLYSKTVDAFDDNDRGVIEAVAAAVAFSAKCAGDSDRNAKHQAQIIPSIEDHPKVYTSRRA